MNNRTTGKPFGSNKSDLAGPLPVLLSSNYQVLVNIKYNEINLKPFHSINTILFLHYR